MIEKPDPRAADIALKAKQEEERKMQARKQRQGASEKKAREQKEAEEQRDSSTKSRSRRKSAWPKHAERQQRETDAMRRRQSANRRGAAREQQSATRGGASGAALARAEADWIRRIQAKVKGNVIVPPDIAGNPEAIFEVVQLPTGEIIDATLQQVERQPRVRRRRAARDPQVSPLPRPERPELFQRALTLKFRPQD